MYAPRLDEDEEEATPEAVILTKVCSPRPLSVALPPSRRVHVPQMEEFHHFSIAPDRSKTVSDLRDADAPDVRCPPCARRAIVQRAPQDDEEEEVEPKQSNFVDEVCETILRGHQQRLGVSDIELEVSGLKYAPARSPATSPGLARRVHRRALWQILPRGQRS